MFLKSIFEKVFTKQELNDDFWVNFKATVNLYKCNKTEQFELFYERCTVFFIQKQEDKYDYEIVFSPQESNEPQYVFPIHSNMHPKYETRDDNQTIDLKLMIEFNIFDDDYVESGQFREILARLIFQTKNKRNSMGLQDDSPLDNIVKKVQRKRYSEKIQNNRNKFKKDLVNLFVECGKLQKLDPDYTDQPPELVCEEALFVIKNLGNYQSSIIIYDQDNEIIDQKLIDEQLVYYTSDANNSVTWLQSLNDEMICYNFMFINRAILDLKIRIASSIMEQMRKQSFEDIIKQQKEDWDDYYNNNESINDIDDDEYKQYGQEKQYLEIDEEFESDFQIDDYQKFGPIINFKQAKVVDRAFCNRGKHIDVFKIHNNNDDVLSHVTDLPIIKSYEGQHLIPNKIQLMNSDQNMLFIDQTNKNKIYDYDITKGKIVKEYEGDLNQQFNDLTLDGGKNEIFSKNQNILGLSNSQIVRMDPRMKKYKVDVRKYKVDPQFTNILGIGKNKYVVGSKTGDLRFYDGVGPNAKNLIPSFLGDSILNIDCTKDGKLILLTFKSYLVLLDTCQQDSNAFTKRFQKKNKPKPRILKVSPRLMAQNDIFKVQFKQSCFNEKKDQAESFIMATTEHYIFFWQLKEVLKNHLQSTQYYRIEEKCIQGEFIFNEDNILTAVPEKLMLSKTMIKKKNNQTLLLKFYSIKQQIN